MALTRGIHRVEVVYDDGQREVYDKEDWTIFGTSDVSPIPQNDKQDPQVRLEAKAFHTSRRFED